MLQEITVQDRKDSSNQSWPTRTDPSATKAIRYLEAYPEPTHATPLLPPAICRAVIARSQPQHQPMGAQLAKQACVMFLANYPYAMGRDGQEVDRKFYAAQVQSVFARFPEWAAAAVSDPVSGLPHREPKFLPTAGELAVALQFEMGRDQAAAVRAKKHLAEGRRRAAEPVMTETARLSMAEKLACLSAKLKSTPVIEPVAGRDPVDIEAQQRRKKALAELDLRRASRSAEELDEDARIVERLAEIRLRQSA